MAKKKKNYSIIYIMTFFLLIGGILFLNYHSLQQSAFGQKEIPFSQNYETSLFFGLDQFTASPLQYKCTTDRTTISYPYKEDSCWLSLIGFQGKNYVVNPKQRINLNPYLDLELKSAGNTLDCSSGSCLTKYYDQWSNQFVFYIINEDFIKAEKLPETESIILNSNKTISISITNDFADKIRGGIFAEYKTGLIYSYDSVNYDFNLARGAKNYEISIPTSNLGKLEIKATPYIYIFSGKQTFKIMGNTISYVYNILPNVSSPEPPIIEPPIDRCALISCAEGFECEKGQCVKKEEANYIPLIIISLLVIFALAGLFWILKKRKK